VAATLSNGLSERLKYRCPYCRALLDLAGLRPCPQCGKSALPPGFFGGGGSGTAVRPWEPRKAGFGLGALFARPLRIVLALAGLAVLGGALLQQARRPAPDGGTRRREVAGQNLSTLAVALDQHRRDTGRYPTTREGLVSLVHDPGLTGWAGPYVYELKADPWGRPFRYESDGRAFRVSSAGPDGAPATADDVSGPDVGSPTSDP
jgi:general secretion pathway protein G